MKTVFADCRLPEEAKSRLSSLGFKVISLPPIDTLDKPLASHTDMLLFRYKDEIITSVYYKEKNRELFEKIEAHLPDYTFIYTDDKPSGGYPSDAVFNALVIEDRLFCKTDSVSPAILDLAKRRGLKVIPTKQGYPACLTLYAGGLAVTTDRGLAESIRGEGFSVLLIPESEKIELPPYRFGFIGGASGRRAERVYFIGNLDAHPMSAAIRSSFAERGIECTSLTDGDALYDLGGILFA